MKLEHSAIVIRRRTVLETVDLAFRFVFGACPGLLLRLTALVAVAGLCLVVSARYLFDWGWGWVWMLGFAWASVCQGLFTLAVGRALFSPDTSPAAVVNAFLRRLGPFCFSLLVSRVLILLSALVLAPLPWLLVRFAYVHEAVLLEGASGWGALSRSARMVRHFGRVCFAAQLVRGALLVCVVVACEFLGDGVVGFVLQLGRPLGALFQEGGSVFSLLGLFLSGPLVASARFLAYIDSRTRRDAWDVQVRFMSVRAEEEAALAAG